MTADFYIRVRTTKPTKEIVLKKEYLQNRKNTG